MLKNAMEFNEPGSTVYKDAETLKLMMSAVMSDIMLASPNTAASKSDKRWDLFHVTNFWYLVSACVACQTVGLVKDVFFNASFLSVSVQNDKFVV